MRPPQATTDDDVASVRCHRMLQADFRRAPAAGFFADVSLAAAFLPAIGISISFWPEAAFLGFFAGLSAFAGAACLPASLPASLPTLRRSASMRSTTFSPFGRSFGRITLPARFSLISSISAVS